MRISGGKIAADEYRMSHSLPTKKGDSQTAVRRNYAMTQDSMKIHRKKRTLAPDFASGTQATEHQISARILPLDIDDLVTPGTGKEYAMPGIHFLQCEVAFPEKLIANAGSVKV